MKKIGLKFFFLTIFLSAQTACSTAQSLFLGSSHEVSTITYPLKHAIDWVTPNQDRSVFILEGRYLVDPLNKSNAIELPFFPPLGSSVVQDLRGHVWVEGRTSVWRSDRTLSRWTRFNGFAQYNALPVPGPMLIDKFNNAWVPVTYGPPLAVQEGQTYFGQSGNQQNGFVIVSADGGMLQSQPVGQFTQPVSASIDRKRGLVAVSVRLGRVELSRNTTYSVIDKPGSIPGDQGGYGVAILGRDGVVMSLDTTSLTLPLTWVSFDRNGDLWGVTPNNPCFVRVETGTGAAAAQTLQQLGGRQFVPYTVDEYQCVGTPPYGYNSVTFDKTNRLWASRSASWYDTGSGKSGRYLDHVNVQDSTKNDVLRLIGWEGHSSSKVPGRVHLLVVSGRFLWAVGETHITKIPLSSFK